MKAFKSGSLNIDVVLKLIILLGFSLFFFITVQSGTIQLLVHPRIIPFLKFGIVIMIIMSLFLLKDIFKLQREKTNLYQYLFFIIPLIMAFSLPVKEINSGSVAIGNSTGTVMSGSSTARSKTPDIDSAGSSSGENILSEDTEQKQNTDTSFMDGTEEEDSVPELKDNTVIMDDSNFVMWIDEIYSNPSKYEGKKIIVTGFVFKDKQFKENEFVPARMMMTCCAADMSTVGLLARYDKTSELRENRWFEFTGTIVNSEFNGDKVPVVNIESAKRIAKPQNEYVYPY
ncbi:putative membrane protein [Ruminiclostridium sufflavum DSM 19573]|uniref:Putative membrane protein n=1 Tax=Ruminiclostridium sufflavum DSM 19573 TaxID=1121337 RepID=A0A318XS30_9FIRM|nr:TIGR03943 family protein [Ruminiclostridium sufflavum]PYG89051.1 putative membrane protein [Ruminiclostridium sufflavum DSM 19573]